MKRMIGFLGFTCVVCWSITTLWYCLSVPESDQQRIQQEYGLTESVQVSGQF